MSTKAFVACDLGAESGRLLAGELSSGKVALRELHRFPTGGVTLRGTLRWDLPRFWEEVQAGLRKLPALGAEPAGVSVDAWGVDYAWFSEAEPLISLPYHYRDDRTDASYPATVERLGRDLIFRETGVQFMQINTLYQLADDASRRRSLVEAADGFLPIADYFHYLLCGEIAAERSAASTTQIFNPRTLGWSGRLVAGLGLPDRLFPPTVPSGTRLGTLLPAVAAAVNARDLPVYATCSHDTGAAVAGVPAQGKNWAFISSGTWSLLGVETATPVMDPAVQEANYTNEVGHGDRVRFLRNLLGLWLLQEVRRELAATGETYDYPTLTALAEKSHPFASVINPNRPEFLKPGGMIAAIQRSCRASGQPVPEGAGAFSRCILESLALAYAEQIGELQDRFGFPIDVVHVVGGGSQSRLLNQFTADACRKPVLAGPVEATALGNALLQAVAAGELGGADDVREVVRRSTEISEYLPQHPDAWREAAARFRALPL